MKVNHSTITMWNHQIVLPIVEQNSRKVTGLVAELRLHHRESTPHSGAELSHADLPPVVGLVFPPVSWLSW